VIVKNKVLINPNVNVFYTGVQHHYFKNPVWAFDKWIAYLIGSAANINVKN